MKDRKFKGYLFLLDLEIAIQRKVVIFASLVSFAPIGGVNFLV